MLSDIVANAIVVFMITYTLRHLDGPWDVFVKLRAAVGIKRMPVLDEYGNTLDWVDDIEEGKFTKLFSCFWCLGTWVSLIVSTVFVIANQMPVLSLFWVWLGAVGLAGLAYEVTER